ncbi:response regulator transcription factor [Actinoplanes regularis]|uniref:DNA-binding response regulator, OmpR family, contains REC and winged-helix (WHTH) domain n=1 Tax=Actinoplanes regularis TaxID=52697 RepID=A0A239FRM2_9ACTN|nr:response regulator transcription factor [Actinoplanes regularis]GIE90177.1 DNA-binding response regulator [Actinoplanes regularis]SNS59238.1 DNA-binding response regulator, OmpR family, contains REC and winged-helix (wHTH) domain [Actinoplanes regularis]
MRVQERVRAGHEFRLLVVAPDPDLRGSLAAQLSLAGYLVTSASTGAGALRLLAEHRVDLIVVDVEIPDLTALAEDRPTFAERPPVLCVVACEFLGTLVPALGTEVADYVTKPLRDAELLARVQVLLRDRSVRPSVLRHGELLLDESTCRGWRGDRPLGLTPAEYRLLRHLMLNAGRILSKDQLAWQVWSESRGVNAIERLVSRVRRKVDDTSPPLIRTHRGFGYLLTGDGTGGTARSLDSTRARGLTPKRRTAPIPQAALSRRYRTDGA